MSKNSVIVNTVEWESIPITIPVEYMEHFDFIDLGAKNGKMRTYAQQHFNGINGLHFEINSECIETMEKLNIPCVQADITNLILPENCVDFVISTHTIEHLENLEAVKKMIETSANTAKDFIYLTWPSFDSESYLKELGFILFPSTWDGHSCHVTISDLKNILKELSLEGIFMAWPRILDSRNDWVLPIDYPRNIGGLNHYKPEYGTKPIVNFTQPVYTESVCLIVLQNSQKTKNAIDRIKQYNWDIL